MIHSCTHHTQVFITLHKVDLESAPDVVTQTAPEVSQLVIYLNLRVIVIWYFLVQSLLSSCEVWWLMVWLVLNHPWGFPTLHKVDLAWPTCYHNLDVYIISKVFSIEIRRSLGGWSLAPYYLISVVTHGGYMWYACADGEDDGATVSLRIRVPFSVTRLRS